MGGPPNAFPTPNSLIRLSWRKLAFYAPLPHFENPCLLELPIQHSGRSDCRLQLLSWAGPPAGAAGFDSRAMSHSRRHVCVRGETAVSGLALEVRVTVRCALPVHTPRGRVCAAWAFIESDQ